VTKLENADTRLAEGNLEVALGQQTQNVAFYVSRDGKYLFRGDAVDRSIRRSR
jgi:hypothetical protein